MSDRFITLSKACATRLGRGRERRSFKLSRSGPVRLAPGEVGRAAYRNSSRASLGGSQGELVRETNLALNNFLLSRGLPRTERLILIFVATATLLGCSPEKPDADLKAIKSVSRSAFELGISVGILEGSKACGEGRIPNEERAREDTIKKFPNLVWLKK